MLHGRGDLMIDYSDHNSIKDQKDVSITIKSYNVRERMRRLTKSAPIYKSRQTEFHSHNEVRYRKHKMMWKKKSARG